VSVSRITFCARSVAVEVTVAVMAFPTLLDRRSRCSSRSRDGLGDLA
jgi:hypothetical protein